MNGLFSRLAHQADGSSTDIAVNESLKTPAFVKAEADNSPGLDLDSSSQHHITNIIVIILNQNINYVIMSSGFFMRHLLSTTLLFCSLTGFTQISISPTSIEVSSKSAITEINLSNLGDEERMFETTVKAWSQSGSEDHFEDTKDALILPKAATIKPKGKQKLRVILQKPAPEKTRQFYRIFVSEVVPNKSVEVSGLRFLLSISIPLFSSGPQWVQEEKPEWALVLDNNKLFLSLANKGNTHLLVQDLEVVGQKADKLTAMQYVLPKSEHRFALPSQFLHVKKLDFKFSLSGQNKNISLTVPKPIKENNPPKK